MTKLNPGVSAKKQCHSLKVRVIKAPLVDSNVLKEVLSQRQRALVL